MMNQQPFHRHMAEYIFSRFLLDNNTINNHFAWIITAIQVQSQIVVLKHK